MPNQAHFVSVVIPVLNEAKIIETCLNSVIAQDYPKDQMEIMVIDGMSTDSTRDIIQKTIERDDRFILLDNPKKNVPCALNIGIKRAKGDIIVRMDSHTVYPPNYVSLLVGKLIELDAANVGGVIITTPADNSSMRLSIAICSSHPFGVGPSLFKIGATDIVETDTVPFGCFRKSIFEKVGYFDEDMLRNEDEELNGRITRAGGKIYLIPEMKMTYYPRDNYQKMARMYYQYGLWKPLVNKKVGNAVSYRQFVPPLFVVGLIGGLVLGCIFPVLFWIYVPVLILYFFITLLVGIESAVRHSKPALCLTIPFTFFCIHLSYGFGYLKGLCHLLRCKNVGYQLDR